MKKIRTKIFNVGQFFEFLVANKTRKILTKNWNTKMLNKLKNNKT